MIGVNDSGETLVELAKQRSLAGRRRLHGEMTDLILADAHRLNDRDRATMGGILRKLLVDVEMDIRRTLIARIGEENVLPSELLAVLGNDAIEWTRSVLADTGALADIDLIDAIDARARAHRLIAFLRQAPTENGESALDRTVEDPVETWLRHPDPVVSKRAMELLVAEARTLDRFREPLLHRQDLPETVAESLYWRIGAGLRFALLRDFTLDPLLLDTLIERSTREALAARGGGDATAMRMAGLLVTRLQEIGVLRPAIVADAMRCGHFAVATATLALVTRLDESQLVRFVLDADGESLAIACKANAIERGDLARLLDLLAAMPENRTLRMDAGRVLTFFDKVSAAQADAVCRHWRLHPGYKRAVESLARNA